MMPTASVYERLTRGMLTVWVCSALGALCVFGVPGQAWLRVAVPMAFALGAVLARSNARVVAVPAAIMVAYPALFIGALGSLNGLVDTVVNATPLVLPAESPPNWFCRRTFTADKAGLKLSARKTPTMVGFR